MADDKHGGGGKPKVRADDRRGAAPGVQGNQPFVPREGERERVAVMAEFLNTRQIGILLRGPDEPLSGSTIERHFADVVVYHKTNLLNIAVSEWKKNIKAGKEASIRHAVEVFGDPGQFVVRREISGPGGGPVQVLDVAALKELSVPDLERFADLASRLAEVASRDDTGEVPPVPDAT